MDRGRSVHHSDKLAQMIDDEVKKIVNQGYDTAKKILTKHNKQLHELAQALIEFETLSGNQIKNLLLGHGITETTEHEFPSGKKLIRKDEKKDAQDVVKKKAPVKATAKKSRKIDDKG